MHDPDATGEMGIPHIPISGAMDEAEDLMLEQARQAQAFPVELAKVDRRSARRMRVAIAMCLLISILSLTFGGYAVKRAAAAEASLQLAQDAEKAYVLARADLQRQGVPESAIPNQASAQVDTSGIIRAATAAALAAIKQDADYRGPAGLNGSQGPPGLPGKEGDRGERGETCPSGTSLQPTVVRNGDNKDITIIACRE